MNVQDLDQALPLDGGALTLTTSSVDGLLADFLIEDNAGQPFIIGNATKTVTDTQVVVDGTTSYLNVFNAPAHAVFTVQADNSAAAGITISLPAGWKFSTSFPNLPPFKDQSASDVAVLDELLYTQPPSFVIATASGTDAGGAPLVPGLNFVGHFNPSGLAGLFATMLGGDASYLLYGTIDLPQATATTPDLPWLDFPWDPTWTVPGIDIQAPLGIDFSVASLHVGDVVWRVYSPTDAAWLADNPTYDPLLAVAGTMKVPSASISATVTAVVELDVASITFYCDFEGATVGNLAALTDLVNGGDLASILPQDIASALSGIAVESANVAFDGSFGPEAVDSVTLVVGMPGVTWDILLGVFSVGDLAAYFGVPKPFTSERSLSVTLGGEIDVLGMQFDVTTQYPGFTTYASASGTVSLQTVFVTLVPGLPAPPDLNVDAMELNITPGQTYSFTIQTSDDPQWTLDLGPVPMTIGATSLDVWDDGAGMQGTFTGTLEFTDEIETQIVYDTPGSFLLRAEMAEVKLSDFIARLDEIGVDVPSGFDITFDDCYVLIEADSGGNLTFSAGAMVDSLGLIAFTAEKNNGQWGYAAGVQLDLGGDLASIPGLAPLEEINSFVGLTEILMLVSSIDAPGFIFPDMNAFNAPPLQGHSMPLPPVAKGVVKGVNIYAQLSLAKDKGFQLLAQYLGIKLDGTVGLVIAISAPDPGTSSKLYFTVGADINSNTRLDGEMGVLVQNGDFGVFLLATVKTTLQSQPATFTVSVVVVPAGILIAGTMQGTIAFAPVQLSNVAVEIGVDDAGIPSVGFAATIDVSSFESSIAVFFDSTDPANSMFAGALSEVTLLDIANTIAGQSNVPSPIDQALAQFALRSLSAFPMPSSVAASLDARDLGAVRGAFAQGGVMLPASDDQIFFVTNTAGSVWHLTDLSTMLHYELVQQPSGINAALQPQIYFAPKTTYVGALKYPQGIHVDAEIDAFLVKAQIRAIVQANVGIAVDASAEPITIVSSSFFTITGTGANGGPILSLATFTQPAETDPMLQPPHFLLSGAMTILGSTVAGIYVGISASGLAFDFKEQVAAAVNVDLNGSVSSTLALAIGGSGTAGIDQTLDAGALGKIHVVTTVNCSFDIGADSSGAHASVQGSFNFEGLLLSIPKMSLDISSAALANLPSTLWNEIEEILNQLLLDSATWLKWVGDGIVSGAAQTAEEVGQVLDSTFHLVGNDIAAQTQSVLNYTTDQVTEALEGAGYTAEETAGILTSVGYTAEEAADAVEDVFTGEGHVDFSLGHADVPAGPHGDIPQVHTDLPQTHADTDSVHTDEKTSHSDSSSWGVHWDIKGFHTDVTEIPHVDGKTPHSDAATPHADGPTTPHGDSGTHVDT